MKKAMTVFLSVMVAVCLSSCSLSLPGFKKSPSLKAAVLTGTTSDSTLTSSDVEEYGYWTYDQCNLHERQGAPAACTIVFDGIEYSGQYQYSYIEYFNTYETDVYMFEGGDFSVKAGTTDLVRIRFPHDEYGNLSRDICQAMAVNLASQYISTDEYLMTATETPAPGNEDAPGLYSFVFQRYVNDIPTSAWVNIIYSSNGELIWFEKSMVEEWNDCVSANDLNTIISSNAVFTSDKISELVSDLVQKSYPDAIEYDILNETVVLLPDGGIGKAFSVDISVNNSISEEEFSLSGEQTFFLIYES